MTSDSDSGADFAKRESESAVAQAKALLWPRLPRLSLPLADDCELHCSAPLDKIVGADDIERRFRAPLSRAFGGMTFRPHLFLGGAWKDEIWIAATGNIVGEFRGSFLGIPPSRREAKLRTGAFWKTDNNRVAEARVLFDLPGLAAQSGIRLLPPFAGDAGPPPGPVDDNGIRLNDSPRSETEKTLALVEAMLGGCNKLEGDKTESMGMSAFWDPEMLWHGPWGIGTCRGFDSFQRNAQGPSVKSFPNRRGGFHRCRFADGEAAAFTGWPSLRGTFNGEPFRGIAPTGGEIGQRIMDFYIRRGERLAENWVLIDLVDFARQCGVDLLSRPPEEV